MVAYPFGYSFIGMEKTRCPTGIKIFSWLSYSLSKSNLTNMVKPLNLYVAFPRSNRKYMTPNTSSLSLVSFGSNLGSTVGFPNFTKILQHMVLLPPYLSGVIVGLLLSDA